MADAAPPVAVIGTLDTKGAEVAYLAAEVRAGGGRPIIYDCGVWEPRGCVPDVPRDAVARAAGSTVEDVGQMARGDAVAAMGRGLRVVLEQAWRRGEVRAAVAAGGSGGTFIAAAGMTALPVGVGKIIVSTVAMGHVGPYVAGRDLTLMYAVVDVAGLNRVSRAVLRNAGRAAAAMAQAAAEVRREGVRPDPDQQPLPAGEASRGLVCATMFGVTTPAVTAAREYLEARGYEVLVFHATGTGGRAMEDLVASGLVDGVLDLTTTEWADEVVGGVLSAGPDRLRAPGQAGIPHVVAPGALDMVNFGAWETVPERFGGRRLHRHNPQVTLMRTTAEENVAIAREMAVRLTEACGPVAVLLPLRGFSALDREGEPFWDPQADRAFRDALVAALPPAVRVRELDAHINDAAFAVEAARELEAMMERRKARDGAQSGAGG